MRTLRAFWFRLRGLIYKQRSDHDTTEELEAHLRLHADDSVRAGLEPGEARRQALIALGGLQQARERRLERAGIPFIDELLQDLRFAARLLLKDRPFATTAVLVLGLGIGMSNTFFTIVNAMCLRGLTLDRPDRVMDISTRDGGGRDRRMSYLDLEDVRASATTFAEVGAFAPRSPIPMSVADDTQAPQRVMGSYVSSNVFRIIGESPLAGRDFRPEDDRAREPAVVILGRSVWQSRYRSDPAIVGRAIRVNGESAVVIGVMPDRSKFPNNTEIWLPLHSMPAFNDQKRDVRTLSAFGRLVGGAAPTDARSEMEALAARLAREHPETNREFRIAAVPINDEFVVDITNPAWIAFSTAGVLVLLVACANVANLLLMRSMSRSREFAVRASLGATRGRVIRQLLCESLLLALTGGALGVVLSIVGTRVLWLSIPSEMVPYWWSFTLDGPALAFITAVCIASSFIFGLTPALHVSKTDVNYLLKDGGRTATRGIGTRRWTSAFLVTQFALAMVFLSLIALQLISMRAVGRRDPELPTASLVTASLALPPRAYATVEDRRRFYDRLDGQLRTLNSLTSWSVASTLSFDGVPNQQLTIQGRSDDGKVARMVWTVSIGPRYFDTLGLDMVRGRPFDDRDGDPGAERAIVNRDFAEVYFPGGDPVGQRIRVTAEGATPSESWLEIIGVSPTIRHRDTGDADPIVYVPSRAASASVVSLFARGRGGPEALGSDLREEIRRLDPDLPLYRVMTLEQAIEEARWNPRLSNVLVVSISLIAVALAAVGLFAVTAHAVSQRTQEIGVRMALGAQPWRLVWLALKRAVLQLGLGMLFGVGCVFAWDRAFHTDGPIQITDPINMVAAAGMLAAIAGIACLVPVLRAMHVDPVVVLRYE